MQIELGINKSLTLNHKTGVYLPVGAT